MDYTLVLIDNPAPHVRRVTLNRLTHNVTQAGTATPAADYRTSAPADSSAASSICGRACGT